MEWFRSGLAYAVWFVVPEAAATPPDHADAWETAERSLLTLFFGGLNDDHPTTDPDQSGQSE
jgi:hypothetical protein